MTKEELLKILCWLLFSTCLMSCMIAGCVTALVMGILSDKCWLNGALVSEGITCLSWLALCALILFGACTIDTSSYECCHMFLGSLGFILVAISVLVILFGVAADECSRRASRFSAGFTLLILSISLFCGKFIVTWSQSIKVKIQTMLGQPQSIQIVQKV